MTDIFLTRRTMLRGMLAATFFTLLTYNRAFASVSISITDLAGRTVTLPRPVRRLLVGDGALAYVLPLLKPNAPFGNVVGWGENFRLADLNGYDAYLKRFPGIATIPTFPATTTDAINAELAISLAPDLVLMNLSSLPVAQSSGLIERLERAGIPLIFVDFRTHMFANATRSMQLIGELLGCQERTNAFLQFREEQIARVEQRLQNVSHRPLVVIERAAGMYEDCCMSYGPGNLGEMVNMAGGKNLGSTFIPSNFGTLHPEQIITSDPDVVIVTGANWSLYAPTGDWVNLGPGADPVEGQNRLQRLMTRPAYRTLRAVHTGQVYAIWHAFYDNPYNFIALQRIAKWLHPTRFADLDPEETFQELHKRFLPIPYQPGYWLNLNTTASATKSTVTE
ncbi:ABC transporter substrate-binding protein [Xenorhabdus beddingii]|uniref:ABC transporter substrate-binding protein n=1 Tax=Xenorhabdus beddingii TaxID=40578 RepID=UPI001AC00987|nr:ABC transporter substrate-binding protein [Xenorhabdus beddingii]